MAWHALAPSEGAVAEIRHAEPPASTSDDVASALERLAARVRSGDLFVPSALAATSEEAVLAAVLAALLQRSRG